MLPFSGKRELGSGHSDRCSLSGPVRGRSLCTFHPTGCLSILGNIPSSSPGNFTFRINSGPWAFFPSFLSSISEIVYPALISSIWNFRFGVNLGIYALACAFPFSWNALGKIHSASLYFKVEVKSYPLRVLFYADNSVRLFLQWKNEITMRLELIN